MPASSESLTAQMGRALKWHWNLLFLGAGATFAVLSGLAGVVIPALIAGEVAYLGFLGTNRRFQNVLRGRKLLDGAAQDQSAEAARTEARLRQLVDFLDPADRARFEALRLRSRTMTELQRSMRSEGSPVGDAGFKTQSLDKLLWLFLKLLHHKAGLEQFLFQTSEPQLNAELSDTELQLEEARGREAPERLISSLEDKLGTIRDRLSNYAAAAENLQILQAELDKTEQKINHICEVGMTSRDGSDLSNQIDGVADSVRLSERALADLDLGGLFEEDEAPPPLVSNEAGLLELQ